MNESRPITIQIAALGGEGGGVLTDWIVQAASACGFPAQSTSIPGVAQRTGATTYYIEILPVPTAALDGCEPVLSLNPALGEVDIVVASELLEAGRMAAAGFVTPDRTLLIASTHRTYAIGERSAMADGRYDGERLLAAVREAARDSVLFDMERAARESASAINAVLLGAIAGCGRLPIPAERFRAAIESSGIAVKGNLAGFAAGMAGAMRHGPAEVGSAPAAAIEPTVPDFDAPAQGIVAEGVRRLAHYQDRAYAERYLARLRPIQAAERARNGSGELTAEVARQLALRMSYEDVIRVAQLKSAPGRIARIRAELKAEPDDPVTVVDYLKPGIEELCSLLPAFLAKPLLAWAARGGRVAKVRLPMKVNSTSVTGYLRLRLLAGLRPWRPFTHRFREEQAWIDAWLASVGRAAARDLKLAAEIAACAALIKGYGDTHERGWGNYARIDAALIAPAIAGAVDPAVAAGRIAAARTAALADPEGQALSTALARPPETARHARAAE